ncbi:hypothetical protein J1N35_026368, partial [Gossypium stocksii]
LTVDRSEPSDLRENFRNMGPHVRFGPYAQINLARIAHTTWPKIHMPVCHVHMGPHACMAHTTTLKPLHASVQYTIMLSSTTRPCLAHGHPYGQPHTCVASTVATFDFCRNSDFCISGTHMVRLRRYSNHEPSRTEESTYQHLKSVLKHD